MTKIVTEVSNTNRQVSERVKNEIDRCVEVLEHGEASRQKDLGRHEEVVRNLIRGQKREIEA
ncbi:hypothetical protein, partial [Klebsiella pneumoniae]|uniref:hypothetical protein n=1 Tax=Klebsiella pneumoniae TaxID=573 RepID=UPI00405549C0